MKYVFVIAGMILIVACKSTPQKAIIQKSLATVDSMSALPQPLQIIDYAKLAKRFDSTVYDFNASGDYWPLVWIDSSRKNFDQPVVGMYTAIGDVRQGAANHNGMFHESLATMGGVLGATLVGVNKSNQQGFNYVSMLKNYFNRDTRWDIMMNNTCPEVAALGGGYGRDWWYDVFPNVLFYAVYDKYPNESGFDSLAIKIADKFYLADSILNGNYEYSFFDYAQMKPVKSHICAQPDAAAGHAYVLYSAYKRFKDPKYLKGAISALDALAAQPRNPSYEVLMPFGAYVAARINAEEQKDYSVQKLLEWSFDGTAICREGWGFLKGTWNGFDISGIVGSTVDHGGYGFLMNTYDAAWPLVPLVRYDPSYASAIGKWILHAANAAKLFYPEYMPIEHQTIPHRAELTKGVIGYEGIVKTSTFEEYASIQAPVAQGDGPKWVPGKNPDVSQFSVYGSAHVGIFGSIIQNSNVEGVLQINLLSTDFFKEQAYPTYLYYNPFNEEKKVTIQLDNTNESVDIYEVITDTFIAKGVHQSELLRLKAGQSAVLVLVPANSTITKKGKHTLANGVIINYQTP